MPVFNIVINTLRWDSCEVEAADRDEAIRLALAGEGEYQDSGVVDETVDEVTELTTGA